jgi:hypothetical protein
MSQNKTINASDVLGSNWTDSVASDGSATTVTSLLENLNVSYPHGTFGELAIPNAAGPINGDGQASTGNLLVRVQMVAHRAHLRCQTLPQADYTVAVGKDNATDLLQNATIRATYALPTICLRGGREGNGSVVNFDYAFMMDAQDTENYVAKILDLHVGPYSGQYTSHYPVTPNMEAVGENGGMQYTDNPPGCPSLALIYGYLSSTDLAMSNAGNNFHAELPNATLAVQVCYQEIQNMSVNVTLQGSTMIIDPTNPPVVDETSVQNLNVPTLNAADPGDATNETAFQFRIQPHLDELTLFNNSLNPYGPSSNLSNDDSELVDNFFQGVFFGRESMPLETMTLANQTDLDNIRTGILAFYRRYMAQAMSANMRTNLTQLSAIEQQEYSAELTFQGIISNYASQERLFQHNTPKLVLQCMIGVMMAGGLLALTTMRLHKLLPGNSNPCTIWGQTSLWAGSSWCTKSPHATNTAVYDSGSENRPRVAVVDDSEARSADRAGRFRLGWWNVKAGDGRWRRRYGIDVLGADLSS